MPNDRYPRVVWEITIPWRGTLRRYVFIEQKRGEIAWATGVLLFSIGALVISLGELMAKVAP